MPLFCFWFSIYIFFLKDNKRSQQPIQEGQAIPVPLESLPFFEEWEIIDQHTLLDVKDLGAKEVDVVQTTTFMCRKPCNTYYVQVGPSAGISNFKIDGGSVSSQNKLMNNTEYYISLPKMMAIGEKAVVKISYTYKDTFPSDNEFWGGRKYLEGGVFKFTLILLDERPLKGFEPYIGVGPSNAKRLKIEGDISYKYVNGRPTLQIETSKLLHNQALVIHWNW